MHRSTVPLLKCLNKRKRGYGDLLTIFLSGRLTDATHASESDFSTSNDRDREGSCHTRGIGCHHQYVCGVCLKVKAQAKLLVVTSIVVICEQIAREIEWIERGVVDIAERVDGAVAAKHVITIDRDVDLHSFVVVGQRRALIPRECFAGRIEL